MSKLDVDQILDDYESSRQREAEKQRQALEDERTALMVQARRLVAAFQDIILPVFNQVESNICGRGYFCQIETTRRKHPQLGDTTFEISIKLSTTAGSDRIDASYLAYEGDIEKVTITKIVLIQRPPHKGPEKSPAVPLSSLDADRVQEDLEAFLRVIFPAEPDK